MSGRGGGGGGGEGGDEVGQPGHQQRLHLMHTHKHTHTQYTVRAIERDWGEVRKNDVGERKNQG